jgi:hypothetical protein
MSVMGQKGGTPQPSPHVRFIVRSGSSGFARRSGSSCSLIRPTVLTFQRFRHADLPDGGFSEIAVKPLPQKCFALSEAKIGRMVRAIPRQDRGAYRDRHETWRGWRWTLWHQLTSDVDADGKSAWS